MGQPRLDILFFKGFSFGMLLQIAVGPVCMFVFTAAGSRGLGGGMAAVLAVTLVDALYILFAALGLASFMQSERMKSRLGRIGGLIVILFGLDILLGALGLTFLPKMSAPGLHLVDGPFTRALVLTASNPLTIVFWAGVFSAKIREEAAGSRDILLFSLGAVASTLLFLSGIAVLGLGARSFLPTGAMRGLNGFVGLVLIGLGGRMAAGKLFHAFALRLRALFKLHK